MSHEENPPENNEDKRIENVNHDKNIADSENCDNPNSLPSKGDLANLGNLNDGEENTPEHEENTPEHNESIRVENVDHDTNIADSENCDNPNSSTLKRDLGTLNDGEENTPEHNESKRIENVTHDTNTADSGNFDKPISSTLKGDLGNLNDGGENTPEKNEDKRIENVNHVKNTADSENCDKSNSLPLKIDLSNLNDGERNPPKRNKSNWIDGYEENYDSLENRPSPIRERGYDFSSLWQGDPESKGLRLFMGKDVWDTMCNHAASNTMEVTGDILGCIFKDADGPYIDASGIIKTRFMKANRTSAQDTAESKQHFLKQRSLARYSNLKLVAWYHTHPNLGVFLSGTDKQTKQITYPLWYQVAIVIDPVKKEIGFFYGQKQELKPVAQVYLYQKNQWMDQWQIIESPDRYHKTGPEYSIVFRAVPTYGSLPPRRN